jgi:hypothetical protein
VPPFCEPCQSKPLAAQELEERVADICPNAVAAATQGGREQERDGQAAFRHHVHGSRETSLFKTVVGLLPGELRLVSERVKKCDQYALQKTIALGDTDEGWKQHNAYIIQNFRKYNLEVKQRSSHNEYPGDNPMYPR